MLNVAKLKGTHTAMWSGIMAAEGIFEDLDKESGFNSLSFLCICSCSAITPTKYDELFKGSAIYKELKGSRNVRPSFNSKWGWWGGMAYSGLFFVLGRGIEPWTLHHGKPDHEKLQSKEKHTAPEYPKPDNKLTFDLLSSVALTGTNHEENQPAHLTLKDDRIPEEVNLPLFDGPESRYCPAGRRLLSLLFLSVPFRRLRVRASQRELGRVAAANQRAELHPLQDVFDQGSSPERECPFERQMTRRRLSDRVGRSGGRRRAQI